MPQDYTPLLNTHFRVDFQSAGFQNDISFHSVEGLKVSFRKREGSGKRHPYFENIILRRAYQPNSTIVKWCMDSINNRNKQPVDVLVNLLDAMQKPVCGWHITGAIPIAWGVEDLHAQEPKVLIERIELIYEYFQVTNSEGEIIAPKSEKKRGFLSWFFAQ